MLNSASKTGIDVRNSMHRGSRPTPLEVGLGVALSGTSGAAILAHTFGPLPMTVGVPFIVLPSSLVLGGITLLARKRLQHFHLAAALILLGGWAGAVATLAYDIVRPVLKLLLGFKFNPFAAIPIFGQLMTGLPADNPLAVTAGWAYHFWNGISFGMIFALIRPRGGMLSGLVWGLGLAALMLVTYPTLLHVDPKNPGFLWSDFVGHAVWGLTLGAIVRKWGPRHRD